MYSLASFVLRIASSTIGLVSPWIFNIHLDGSNTILGSAHLKIHIAKEIFQALDVCKHQIIVIRIPGHKPQEIPATISLNRHTGSHQ